VKKVSDSCQQDKTNIAMKLRELFFENGKICETQARGLLKAAGYAVSYPTIQRIFYALRQIGLIEFTHSEPGKAPIDKRFYRIVPGKENDPPWEAYPHHELYPSSKLGALKYEPGTSEGRAKKYVKGA